MATLREALSQRLTGLEAAFVAEKTKLEADLAEVGPLAEMELEQLKSWIAAVAKHL